jgi:ecdysone receptor
VGMRPECVVPENQCAIKRKEKKAQKEKDKATTSGPVSSSPVVQTNRTNSAEFFKSDYMMNLMKCDPPLHQMTHLLSENVLLDNKNKNIPHLTQNQMSVIYKLIWYQDGYEQPSEEDLKRIEEVKS